MVYSSPVQKIHHRIKHLIHNLDSGWLLISLLALFIVQPLLQPGLPAAADYAIHLYRTMEYQQAWAPGVIVPRWAPNLAYGYGYPLFIFAPPLPYMMGLLFHQLGFSIETALKLLIILTIWLYGSGMYLLARDISGIRAVGVVAGVAYAFAPFALREVLLYGGNIPQYLAIGLFPWPLWALTRFSISQDFRWVIFTAVTYAAIILSHLFHALIFTPVLGAYCLMLLGAGWFSKKQGNQAESSSSPSSTSTQTPPLPNRDRGTGGEGRFQRIAHLIALLTPIPLALLISAFSWLPAFIERFNTRAQSDIYLEKSPFFIRYPQWPELISWIPPLDSRAANPYVPLTLGVVTLILAGFGVLALGRLYLTERNVAHPSTLISRLSLTLLLALTSLTAIFMSLPISQTVWETIEILQVAEFPWRMLGLANLGLALLVGLSVLWLPEESRGWGMIIIVMAQLWAIAPLLYPVTDFAQYGQVTLADQMTYERSSQSIGTTTLGEYLPQNVTTPPTTSPLAPIFQDGAIPARLDFGSLPEAATATLLTQTAIQHHYQISSPTDFTLRFFHFDYPGWQATLNGQTLGIKPELDTGLMLMNIPAGNHTLTLGFGETPVRIISLILSGSALIFLTISTIWLVRRPSSSIDQLTPIPSDVNLTFSFILFAILLIFQTSFRPLFTLESPPDQVTIAQYQTNIQFDQGIRLVGYDLAKTQFSPGETTSVVLYWQTDEAPLRYNLQPFVHLDRLGDWVTVATTTNYTPGDVTTESNLPTFHWDTARYIRDEHDVTIPPDLNAQAYALRVGLIDPDQQGQRWPLADGSGDTAQLALVNIISNSSPAPLAETIEAKLTHQSNQIELISFEINEVSSNRVAFSLLWRSEQRPSQDYIVFAQLLDSSQNLVAGFDGPPRNGTYPTSTWQPDQIILDHRFIPIETLAPGEYQLIVGLYDPISQQRMINETGADFIPLQQITID